MRNILCLVALASGMLAADAQAQRRIGPVTDWITGADYPADVRALQVEGTVAVRLGIGTDGRAEQCRVVDAYHQRLAAPTCALLKERARYTPAYDRKGNAIVGEDYIIARWNLAAGETGVTRRGDFGGAVPLTVPTQWFAASDMPDKTELPATTIDLEFTIGPNGRVSSCRPVLMSGSATMGSISCRKLQTRAEFKAPVGTDGKPYATQGLVRVNWSSWR